MVPEYMISELQRILNEADVVSIVRDVMVKFVISLAVFWIVLLALGGWIMWLKRR